MHFAKYYNRIHCVWNKIKDLKKKNQENLDFWEYYNRTHYVRNKIKDLKVKNMKVLDVGGTIHDNLLKKFGIQNVLTINLNEGADFRGSAYALPFKDSSFSVVTTIDTLEHIPTAHREEVLSELIRVSKKCVFIIAPTNTHENNIAEQIVLKYMQHIYIEQHQKEGLVDFDTLTHAIKNNEKIDKIIMEDIDNLHSWLVLMLKDHLDASRLYHETYFLENRFSPRRRFLSIYLKGRE